MHVLVACASEFGSTEEIAQRIGVVLRRHGLEVTEVGAEEADPAGFDAVVAGSAIHGGHWLKEATAFLDRHRDALATRPLWLFSSGPLGDRGVRGQQPDPKEVAAARRSPGFRDHRVFAGAYDSSKADFSSLGLIERTVVKRFLPDGDWRDWDAIESWAEGIAGSLGQASS